MKQLIYYYLLLKEKIYNINFDIRDFILIMVIFALFLPFPYSTIFIFIAVIIYFLQKKTKT